MFPLLLACSVAIPQPPLSFAPQISWELSEAEPSSIRVVDFDGDGDADLGITTQAGAMNVLLNDGKGRFGDKVDFKPGGVCNGFDAADFDGDGKPDLAIVHGSSLTTVHGVSIWLQGARNRYQRKTFLVSGKFAIDVAAADFDRDGKVDLAVLHNVAGGLRVYRGRGDGTFAPGAVLAVRMNGTSLLAVDLDRDGDVDLVASHYSGVAIYDGDGRGGFRYRGGSVYNRLTQAAAVADVNLDGILDLAIVEYYASKVHVELGQRSGRFLRKASLPVTWRCYDVALEDVNADGLPDVCASDYSGARVYLGKGDGTFWPSRVFATGRQASRIAAADLDNDDLVDLAVPYRNLGQTAYVSVLHNTTPTGTWIRIARGRGSATGQPWLSGTGTLAPGTNARVDCSRARPRAPAALVVGERRADQFLFGATLVPWPRAVLPLATDAQGRIDLRFSMPTVVPPRARAYWQAWILDPTSTSGFAVSNGLRSITP